jgi:hypothetical protein
MEFPSFLPETAPLHAPCGHADLQDQAPSSVVNELTSALALEASEKGGKLRAWSKRPLELH